MSAHSCVKGDRRIVRGIGAAVDDMRGRGGYGACAGTIVASWVRLMQKAVSLSLVVCECE